MDEFLQNTPLWLPHLVAMICLISASGFFSGSETSLFYLTHDDLRLLRVGNSRQRMAASLLSQPDRLLTAVLFWNLVINLAYFAISVVVIQSLNSAGETAVAGLFGMLSLFTIILFGEVLPKSVAVVFRHRLATLVSWPLAFTVRVLDPLTPILIQLTQLLRRTFWPHLDRELYLDVDDLERAVEASELSDDVIRHERQVLHNILDLGEISVEEVMRPRGTYTSLTAPASLADLQGEVPPGDCLVIAPPGSEQVDGVVPLADLTSIPETGLELKAGEAVAVPWCANLAETLQLLRDRICSVAEVVNEFGETIGIVTYEDVMDTILMPTPSRARRLLQREPVREISSGQYQVDGITTLRYLCKRLNLEYEPVGDGVVTVAGMVHEELKHIPEVGDECYWRGFHVKVIEVPSRGQVRVVVSRTATAESTATESTPTSRVQ